MFRLALTESEHKKFVKAVKHRMIDEDLTVKDLSEMTGYTPHTIYNFFNKNNSEFIAFALADCLGIKKGK